MTGSRLIILLSLLLGAAPASGYSNVTLSSRDISVVVYLPEGIKDGEVPFYRSSRFEHGSMIGSITRRNGVGGTDIFYGSDLWRIPHNNQWPESGIGLASEFGVGDDGDFCNYRCGWYGVDDVTNGVLGYQEAKNGESFLKIGVGELIKGSCNACDSSEDYRFNSPYRFASRPIWHLTQPSSNEVILDHQAVMRDHGYHLTKHISLVDNKLQVTSTLTNLGTRSFMTAWYSHHFFSCDGRPVGRGYSAELDVRRSYEEPGTFFWSKPLRDYATVRHYPESVKVDLARAVDSGTRIKAEFVKDEDSGGAFTLTACGTSIHENIPDLDQSGLDMYGFNLYIEGSTFSPEPQYLLHLEPGEQKSWTQQLVFEDAVFDDPASSKMMRSRSFSVRSIAPTQFGLSASSERLTALLGVMAFICFVLLRSRNRRRGYQPIPDEA